MLTQAKSPILVLGQAYAGKSELAMQLLAPDQPAVVLGTAPVDEPAFKERLRALKDRRPASWESRDAGLDLATAAESAAAEAPQVLIDSISQWLAALTLGTEPEAGGESGLRAALLGRVDELVRVLSRSTDTRFVLVSAEVGGGPAPARAPERVYRQVTQLANQRLAAWAQSVLVVHAGIALVLK